jgi:hypothetical protein
MKKLTFLLLFGGFLLAQSANAQCPFDPVITGDTILCPNKNGILKTQEYDSYQWYRREWGNSMAEPIQGATGQSLDVTEADVLVSFSVEATLNGCKETSPEVLLDGYVFLLPFVQHTGDYTFDPVAETFKICKGDTMFLTLGSPYNANITWFKDWIPIPGENSNTLAVTESGSYTVEGAPSVCPEFIQPLGLSLPVLAEECATGVKPEPDDFSLLIYPNPVSTSVTLEASGGEMIESVKLTDAGGRLVQEWISPGSAKLTLDMEEMAAGMYFLKIRSGGRLAVRKVVKN